VARLDVTEAIDRAGRGYDHGVVSWIGSDGYPVSVAGNFRADAASGSVELGPLASDLLPGDGSQVGITFSHIRPQPGLGYDERRYVNLWGPAEVTGTAVRVSVRQASGWDEQETPFFEYAERKVDVAHGYFDDVGAKPTLSRWWRFFLATRLPFLTATIVPVGLGAAVAADHGAFRWGWFLLALVAAVSAHLGLNMANDIFDDASGADRANVTPTPFSGGSRVIQYRLVSRRAMIAGCALFYAVSVAAGLALAASRSWWLLAVGAVGLVLSLGYTAPPLKFVYRGLGEPVVAVGFGPVMVMGTYLALARTWSWEAFYVSLPVAILVALVLYVNQVPDRVGDAVAGKNTLIVRFSSSTIVTGYGAAALAAFGLILGGAASGLATPWTALGLLPAILAWRVWQGLRRAYDRPYELMPTMQAGIALHLFTGLALILAYVIATLT
jgi:1,4-dihydroxy-2-naphthoate octaprenyltransferase